MNFRRRYFETFVLKLAESDPQTTDRQAKNLGGVGAIVTAQAQGIKDVPPFDLGERSNSSQQMPLMCESYCIVMQVFISIELGNLNYIT